MTGNSRLVLSNQRGVHERLAHVVQRHLASTSQKPIAEHSRQAFAQTESWLQSQPGYAERPLILDSCCGVGQSTTRLAAQHPDALVVGVDKSADRLARHDMLSRVGNYTLVRADLNDFWRLAVDAGWVLDRHYLLYPNPWPKSAHLQRRWHGAAVFPELLALGGRLELRSNWPIYLKEFQLALTLAGKSSRLSPLPAQQAPLTPFEAKYQASGQQLWQLISAKTD